MGSVTKPKRWNVKPGLTQAPDLWRNVLFAAPLWENGGMAQDLVSGVLAEYKGGSGFTSGSQGTAYDVFIDGDGFYWPVLPGNFDMSDLGDGDFFTVHFHIYITAIDSNTYNRFVEISDTNSSNPRWNIYTNNGSIEFFTNGTGLFSWDYFSALGNDQLHSITMVIPVGNSGIGAALYIDGENQGNPDSETTLTPGTMDNPNAVMGIARGRDGIVTSVHGDYYSVIIWKRELSEDEVRTLHEDPFVMYRPAGF